MKNYYINFETYEITTNLKKMTYQEGDEIGWIENNQLVYSFIAEEENEGF